MVVRPVIIIVGAENIFLNVAPEISNRDFGLIASAFLSRSPRVEQECFESLECPVHLSQQLFMCSCYPRQCDCPNCAEKLSTGCSLNGIVQCVADTVTSTEVTIGRKLRDAARRPKAIPHGMAHERPPSSQQESPRTFMCPYTASGLTNS